MLLLVVGCGSSSETRFEQAIDDFVANWASGAPLCEEQAVCGGEAPEPCAIALMPTDQIEAGVRYARLDAGALYRCQLALGHFSGCLATLDCSTLPDADTHCTEQSERYSIDCAALTEALAFLEADGSGGGGSTGGSGGQAAGGSPSSGGVPGRSGGAPNTGGVVGTGGGPVDGTQAALAEVLCDRAEVCTGVTWPKEEVETCQTEARALFGPLVPDPFGTSGCLSSAPCQEIASGLAALVVECVNLNPGRSQCVGVTNLVACTYEDVCSQYSCREVCGAEGLITTGCGPSRAGGDTCLCGQ